MSVALDPSVLAELDSGRFVLLHLVRIDLPGFPVGYWRGPRDLVWNGFTYKPSRYLDDSGLTESLGIDISQRSLTFSNVPTTDASDVVAKIEQYNYLNAPVTVSKLIGDKQSDQVIGLAETVIYEIEAVSYNTPAINEDGARAVTVTINLEIPGRTIRDKTGVKYSGKEHQAHSSAGDTFMEYSAVNAAWPEEWGRVNG